MANLKIGALARQTGTNTPTIRYYEDIGLLPVADRASGGQRVYGTADLTRLTFIRRCREFGFSVDQVRAFIGLLQSPRNPCTDARDLAKDHLKAIRQKLVALKALERTISGLVTDCDVTCAGGPAPDCVILDDLARCKV
ncbi:MAG TPA: helix-turn-helix domain-containing protein [Bradyrhizobium sp.]|jgi:DNA-binding transcriptional MerR regulator|nr:helix-turn-helix domain-containing protein [Bradyrhizobium sp.]